MKQEFTYTANQRDGFETSWYDNGQKERERNWTGLNVMTVVVWKPNGEKCPVTNLKDGNGVKAYYTPNGGCMIAPPTRTA
jgi:antitoxin component YwqK of YwqJK toxin-antitoxin module